MPIEDGHAVHYLSVARGTPVYGSDEQLVGKVVEVLDNTRECMTYESLASDAGRRTAGGAPRPRAASPSAGAPARQPRRREWSA